MADKQIIILEEGINELISKLPYEILNMPAHDFVQRDTED